MFDLCDGSQRYGLRREDRNPQPCENFLTKIYFIQKRDSQLCTKYHILLF